MKIKRVSVIFGLILVFSLITQVSAGVTFSGIDSVYNLGDVIDLNVQASPVLEDYLLKVDLVCDEKTVIPFNLMPDAQGKAEIKVPLSYNTVTQMSTNCFFSGDYGGEVVKSRKFEITNKLRISLATESYFIKPGEQVEIKGTIQRQNGIGINGNIQITVPLMNLNLESLIENITNGTFGNETSELIDSSVDNGMFTGNVVNGEFLIVIDLAKETPAGNYRIDITSYETSAAGKKMSEGTAVANLKVFQVPTRVEVALSNQNFNPEEEIAFIPELLDQSGVAINDDISISIYDSKQKNIFEKIVKSGESVKYKVPSNLTSGYYDLIVSSGELSSTKKFFVNEKAIVSFELKNQTLVVKNIGNIPYNKDIQIELNGKPFIKRVELAIGEIKEYYLSGTNQDYDVKVSDGEKEMSQQGVPLSGNVVGIDEGGTTFITSPVFWIFLIIILLILAFFFFRNSFKKRSMAYPWDKKKKHLESKGKHEGEKHNEIRDLLNIPKSNSVAPSEAEQVLVSKGYKTNVAVAILKVKNSLGKHAKDAVENALQGVYARKGAVYEHGEYVYIVFSPIVTKHMQNELAAVKSSHEIASLLNEYNQKFNEKIEFGIAVNSGEMINRVEDRKLKFTGLGGVLPTAKKAAELAKEKVLLTREVYEKFGSEVKADRKKTELGDFFELRDVVDNTKNRKFINDFLKRQSNEKK
ncbi:MAG: hypothetical protein PHF67_03490 [Candidatus Nanoarchaeia archaeon]|nr:hypothetical protein [Candidatus Nanoarchaeia archaeon]